MEQYIAPLAKLIDKFSMFPGIGRKTARRLAFFLLSLPEDIVNEFSTTITEARSRVRNCDICSNFTDLQICSICSNPNRDKSTICVVENPKDIASLESVKEFEGVYHVLHGLISPMDGITPEDIKIKELISRLADETVKEVILATNSTVEGEATAIYIAKLIKPLDVKVTRIAYGIPVGGDLEFADPVTLTKAIDGRILM